MSGFDRLKAILRPSPPEIEDGVQVTNTNTGESTAGAFEGEVGGSYDVGDEDDMPDGFVQASNPSSNPSAITSTNDDMPDGEADLHPPSRPSRRAARSRRANEKKTTEKDLEKAKEAERARIKSELEREEKIKAAFEKVKALGTEEDEELPEGNVDTNPIPPEDPEVLEAQNAEDLEKAQEVSLAKAENAPTPDFDTTNLPIVGTIQNLDIVSTFIDQLQKAIDDFVKVNSKSNKRAEEIKNIFSNNKTIVNNLRKQNSRAVDNAIAAFIEDDKFVNKLDLSQANDLVDANSLGSGTKSLIATYLYNKDIRKLFYYDQFRSEDDALLSAESVAVNNEESLKNVTLTTESFLRYASDKELFPTFVLDQKLYIQGVNVGPYLKGNVSVSKNSVSGHNTLTFTLDNSNDRFVWTDRNLGLTVFNRDYFYDEHGNKVDYYDKQSTEFSAILSPFLQYEDLKFKIFAYKSDPIVNPIGVDAAGNKMFTRFDLVPNKCIFNRMDPIRLFTLYPFRPRLGNETSKELWMPEFAGFIENVSIEDDDVLGTSTITIECSDIRQSILTRMRISNSVSTSLANPLDLLGLKPQAVYDEGPSGALGQGVDDRQKAIIDQVRRESPVFFDEKDRTVTFYDDVANSPVDTLISQGLNLEGAVRELLEFKYDALSQGRARRGVNNIEYGGTFKTPWGARNQVVDSNFIRSFLQEYHLFTLFGPKRRPWTPEEVEYVGTRTITTDGNFLGDFNPLNSRLWFLFPGRDSGPSNVVELSVAGIQDSHESSWTNRIEVLRNVIEGVDYHMFVSGTGDIHVEFPFADFRPEDFGIFKEAFRFQRATISTSYSDEAEEPVAGLTVVTGFSANAGNPLDVIGEAFLQKTFVFSPYIAARYGMNVSQTVSVPYLDYTQKALAQQRAVIELQKANARCNTVQFQSAYRPFLLPNRPVHHLRRSRMGIIVSTETTFDIGASPRASISVGLEHVRTWTGGYQNEANPLTIQKPTEHDTRETSRYVPADQVGAVDPYSQQVFTSVMAGTNLPTSNRAVWGVKSPVVANCGVYVIDLNKFTEEQVESTPPPAPATPAVDSSAPAAATPVAPPPPAATPPKKKFEHNPTNGAGNTKEGALRLASLFYPLRFADGTVARAHQGIDIGRSDQGSIYPLYAVNKGTVTFNSLSGEAGYNINLAAENGLKVKYYHASPIFMVPKTSSMDSKKYDAAVAGAKSYTLAEIAYRKAVNDINKKISEVTSKITKNKKESDEIIKKRKSLPATDPRGLAALTNLQAKLKTLEEDVKKLNEEKTKIVVPVKPVSQFYANAGSTHNVEAGDIIGFMSNTSTVSIPVHLHLELDDDSNKNKWSKEYIDELLSLIDPDGPEGPKLPPKNRADTITDLVGTKASRVDPFDYIPGPWENNDNYRLREQIKNAADPDKELMNVIKSRKNTTKWIP